MITKCVKSPLIWGLLITMLVCSPSVSAQNKHKFWGGVEYGKRAVITDNRVRSYPNQFTGRRYDTFYGASVVLGYYVSERTSLGLGIGAYPYDFQEYHALPIYFDFRYHPSSVLPNLLLNAKLGCPVWRRSNTFGERALFTGDFGVGYSIRWKSLRFVPAISYNVLRYRTATTTTDGVLVISPNSRQYWSQHTIGLRLGIYFQ